MNPTLEEKKLVRNKVLEIAYIFANTVEDPNVFLSPNLEPNDYLDYIMMEAKGNHFFSSFYFNRDSCCFKSFNSWEETFKKEFKRKFKKDFLI